jgi:HK97 family phage portal protein
MRWPWQRKATSPPPVNSGGSFSGGSFAGPQVSERNAVSLSAHFACVRLISTTLASLPIHIYEKKADGKRRKEDHPTGRLLHDQPNPDMTAFSFIEAMQAQICNRGVAFAELVFNRKGNVSEIWPIPPGICFPFRERKDGPLKYRFANSNTILPAWKILHIPGLGFDGINSFSPVQLFRQNFGLGMAIEEFGARFFGQGTNIGGFMEHPLKMSDEAYQRLKSTMSEKYQGLQKSHGVIILEEGMKYSKIGMPLDDLQFIESRKFTATEMARIHGVPPHLIGDLEKATFSNIEEQGIEAIIYLFRPWAIRWEQALNAKLFTEEEKSRLYVKFDINGLMRGNIKARYEAYSLGLQNGFFNVDEVRKKEDMNPLPDGQGKVYRFPLHLSEAGKEDKRGENHEQR